MKLSVYLTHPKGKSLPKSLVTTAWGFDGLSVSDALRKAADALEGHALENVTVWVQKTGD